MMDKMTQVSCFILLILSILLELANKFASKELVMR